MSRPDLALQHRSQLARLDPRVEARRIELVRGRREQEIDALGLGDPRVRGLVARVAGEVIGRVELRWVDEEADDDDVGLLPGRAHQGDVPGVEGAHRRHQADALAARPRLAKRLAHLGDGAHDPHGRVASASAR